jgi:hypothetical protein
MVLAAVVACTTSRNTGPPLLPLPSVSCVITDYGAVADNITVNTHAIQRAINSCHAANPEGARVVVPEGAFKTGSLALTSHMELHLEKGAGLYGSEDWSEYPVVAGLPFGSMFRALISGQWLFIALLFPHHPSRAFASICLLMLQLRLSSIVPRLAGGGNC